MKEWDELKPVKILFFAIIVVLIISLFTGCTIYESTYRTPQHNCELMERGQQCLSDHSCCEKREHSTQLYYYDNLPYWGFYNSYYYYYGVPHMYPWWYYYTLIPHYNYNVSTHVYISCNNGYYVSRPRGPKFNNRTHRTYTPNKVIIKSNKRPVIKTNRPTIRNINNTITPIRNRSVKTNTNRTNIKVNTNRNNVKVNTNRTKTNINRSNKNRSNNSNTRRPR
tara:strand:+ start:1532 stop:2200 length:669 start_codon:yes stop_codon:yes gene_type:complete